MFKQRQQYTIIAGKANSEWLKIKKNLPKTKKIANMNERALQYWKHSIRDYLTFWSRVQPKGFISIVGWKLEETISKMLKF